MGGMRFKNLRKSFVRQRLFINRVASVSSSPLRFLRNHNVALVVFLTIAFGDLTESSAQDQPEVLTTAARLKEWRQSIANLSLTWEVRSSNDEQATLIAPASPAEPPSFEMDRVTPFMRENWTWADHGLSYFEMENLKHGYRSLYVWNAPENVSFRVRFRKGPDKDRFESLMVGTATGKDTSGIARLPLHGLYNADTCAWLGDTLPHFRPGFVSREMIGDIECLRFEANSTVLWLDPSHDCLVKRAQLRTRDGRPSRDFAVTDFVRLDSGIWFPSDGTLFFYTSSPPELQEWHVTHVAANQLLDMTRFDLPTPPVE